MKGVITLASIGLLLVMCGWPLIRSDALNPSAGRALLGFALGFVGVILIFVAAAKVTAP